MQSLSKRDRGVLYILMAGVFLSFLNQTLMNTALPSIMREFNITTALGQWMTNGYMLVNGVMVPLTAFLIQRYKTRNLYLTAMVIFATGTLIAGFAPTYPILITGRMIQAIGGGVFGPLMNVIVMNLFTSDKRGAAMGIIGLALNFAPTIGPTLSGFIVSNVSWRWLFLGIAPLMIIDLVLAALMLGNIGEQKFLKFDFVGVILSSIGLGTLLYGFSNVGTGDWTSPNVWAFILIGSLVTYGFVFQQTHTSVPLLNFKVFTYHNFWVAVLINVVLMTALYGGALMLPLYMQTVRGTSALISGLVIMPGALVTAMLSPTSGKLYDQYGARVLAPIGLGITFVGTVILSSLALDTPLWVPVVGQFIRQVGLVLVMMPIQTEAFNAVPLALMPDASAAFTTVRQVAASFGTAALITVYSLVTLAQKQAGHSLKVAEMQGIHTAFWMASLIIVVSGLLTLLLHKRQPSA
ncbi:multidrug efflux MFS transporter [Weissella diestrammenae]|uniref:Multidrug efflux MFS transporter n=1 Tax=Weissella diestrammenae TaxID=1162633 RepID=A0A7G9T726_9LACO|nr:MDR family MFS transporter [Weissella diestrammenae]MCM0582501.1 multidrug efflux MFS transporter [Weissella diestrammenae]QNN75901.1 multidrug efflux MFS transporter [Weissella diestrammenae]